MVSELARDRAYSSASVVDLVTVRCLVAFQSIGRPKSFTRYPSELLRVAGSSANEASEAVKNADSQSGRGKAGPAARKVSNEEVRESTDLLGANIDARSFCKSSSA